MNEMTIFNFKDNEIRTVMIESEPWWVAKDIADVLEYSDTQVLTRQLDEDEKGMHPVHTPGGLQNLTIVNESGLYSAIINSKKPEAKAFKKWVTSEVLPSIRKTGKFEQSLNHHSDLIDDATTDKMIESFLNSYTRKISTPKKKVKTRSIKMEVVDSLLSKLEFQIGEVNKTYAEIKDLFKGR